MNHPTRPKASAFVNLAALLAAFLPALLPAQESVNLSVDWRADRGTTDELTYQLNLWDGINPATATNSTYLANLSDQLQPAMIRIHAREMYSTTNTSKSWVNHGTQTWDATKIDQVLDSIRPRVSEVMLSIPDWPYWMDTDNNDKLDDGTNGTTDKRQLYADWCAELVRIVNVNHSHSVRYWEVLNEKEDKYGWGADTNFASIYNLCVQEMKKVDETIIVGGPALRDPYFESNSTHIANFKAWVTAVKDNLGFFSYHHYGRSSATSVSSDSVYDGADNIGSRITYIRNLLNSQGVSPSLPIYIGESHIYSKGENDDKRHMRSILGANFLALALKDVAENGGARGYQIFNDRDGNYGLMDNDSTYGMRPSAYLLKLAQEHLVGTAVGTTTADASKLRVLAVKNGDKKAILLVNTSDIADAAGTYITGTNYNASITFADSWTPTASSLTIHTLTELAGGGTPPERGVVTNAPATFASTLVVSVPARSIKLVEITDVQNPNRIVRTTVADTYVSQSTPDTNYGTSATLWIQTKSGYTREAFLRYDLSGLTGTIQSATLRLKPSRVGSLADVNHRIDFVSSNTWSESAITWNTGRPSGSGTFLSTWRPVLNTYQDIDVTASVTAAASSADKLVSYRLGSTGLGDDRYYGREDLRENEPELVLQVAPAATPVVAASYAFTAGSNASGDSHSGSTAGAVTAGAGVTAYLQSDTVQVLGVDTTTSESGSITNNDYLSFTLTPGAALSIKNLSLDYRGTSSMSNYSFGIRSSADNYATNLGGVTGYSTTAFTNLSIDLSGVSALQNLSSAVTFRIYVWDSTSSSTRYSVFDNVTLTVTQ